MRSSYVEIVAGRGTPQGGVYDDESQFGAHETAGGTRAQLDLAQLADIERRALRPLDGRSSGEDPFAIRSTLEALMWDNVGLVRDGAGMIRSLDEMQTLKERAACLSVLSSRRLNLAWTEALDVQNLLQVAEAVTRTALVRTES